jgi:hypothetical protein
VAVSSFELQWEGTDVSLEPLLISKRFRCRQTIRALSLPTVCNLLVIDSTCASPVHFELAGARAHACSYQAHLSTRTMFLHRFSATFLAVPFILPVVHYSLLRFCWRSRSGNCKYHVPVASKEQLEGSYTIMFLNFWIVGFTGTNFVQANARPSDVVVFHFIEGVSSVFHRQPHIAAHDFEFRDSSVPYPQSTMPTLKTPLTQSKAPVCQRPQLDHFLLSWHLLVHLRYVLAQNESCN